MHVSVCNLIAYIWFHLVPLIMALLPVVNLWKMISLFRTCAENAGNTCKAVSNLKRVLCNFPPNEKTPDKERRGRKEIENKIEIIKSKD